MITTFLFVLGVERVPKDPIYVTTSARSWKVRTKQWLHFQNAPHTCVSATAAACHSSLQANNAQYELDALTHLFFPEARILIHSAEIFVFNTTYGLLKSERSKNVI